MNFFLVGLGSIGRKHLAAIFKNFPETSVRAVDPIFTLGNQVLEGSPVTVMPEVSAPLTCTDVAIVANWGPDHFDSFLKLVQAGFKRILIEKPLADSLYEVNMIREICLEKEIILTVNHSWHFEEVAARIQKLSSNLDLGLPEMLVVSGGARCLSTTGSHFIHLANQLFKALPKTISGLGFNDSINPRNSKLSFYDGVYCFSYPARQTLSISFSNKSSVAGFATVFWRDAVGYLRDENIVIYERERNREYLDVITRYGDPTRLVFNGEIPKNNVTVFRNVYDYLAHVQFPDSKANLNAHIDSAKTLIQAILANRLEIHTYPQMNHSEKICRLKLGIS